MTSLSIVMKFKGTHQSLLVQELHCSVGTHEKLGIYLNMVGPFRDSHVSGNGRLRRHGSYLPGFQYGVDMDHWSTLHIFESIKKWSTCQSSARHDKKLGHIGYGNGRPHLSSTTDAQPALQATSTGVSCVTCRHGARVLASKQRPSFRLASEGLTKASMPSGVIPRAVERKILRNL